MLTKKQEEDLAGLREKVAGVVTGKRLTHTYGVEREITRLSEIYAPDEEYRLRAAALLHEAEEGRRADSALRQIRNKIHEGRHPDAEDLPRENGG